MKFSVLVMEKCPMIQGQARFEALVTNFTTYVHAVGKSRDEVLARITDRMKEEIDRNLVVHAEIIPLEIPVP